MFHKASIEPSDGALVRACRSGDEAAWELLVRRYQRLVHTIALRAGLDQDAAADVFQEVFAALVQHLDSLDDPERVRAWIVTTARRLTWRAIVRRNATRLGEIVLDEQAENVPDGQPLPEHVVARLEEQHAVRVALSSLDERCQRLLSMLFYAHPAPSSYGEVAAALGVAEGSVGPLRARCLERLLRLLD